MVDIKSIIPDFYKSRRAATVKACSAALENIRQKTK